jgi:hypothetical protein
LLVNIRFSSKILNARLSFNRLVVEYRKSYPHKNSSPCEPTTITLQSALTKIGKNGGK